MNEEFALSMKIVCQVIYSSRPYNSYNKDWVKLNKNTIGKIRQLVDYNVYQCVTYETNAYKVWNTLQELYEKNNAQDKAFLN